MTRAVAPVAVNLRPLGEARPGTYCPCGNQRRASRRCCRACERYFWRRNGELHPVVPMPPACARVRFALSSDVCPAITADTVALAVSVQRTRRPAGADRPPVPPVSGSLGRNPWRWGTRW